MKENGRKNRINIIRRAVQLAFFIFLPGIMAEVYNCLKVIVKALAGDGWDFAAIAGGAVILLGVTAVTALFGRFFCGWVCSFGALGDLVYKLPRLAKKGAKGSKTGSASGLDAALKFFKYAVLAILVVVVWGLQLVTIPAGISPWDFYGMLTSPSSWGSVWESLPGFAVAAVLLAVIVGVSVAKERFFCRYLCPLGAYLGIFNKLSITRIAKPRENCGSCKLCTMKCSMGIDLNSVDTVKSADCIQCMECVRACPKQNAHLEVDSQPSKALKVAAVACVLLLISYFGGSGLETVLAKSGIGKMDSPVGSVYEEGGSGGSSGATGAAKGLADGTYTGSARGYRGLTKVEVTVKSGKITGVRVVSTGDDGMYMNRAMTLVVADIVSEQSTDVDTVSGATYSSNAIKNAVADALKSGGASGSSGSDGSGGASEPGGEQGSGGEPGLGDGLNPGNAPGAGDLPGDGNNGSDSSGGSSSSGSGYADGEYRGSARGYRGNISVLVTVKNGKIASIELESSNDDRQFLNAAWNTVVQRIIDQQDVNVDGVSGATYSSNGIREAVADALGESYVAEETSGRHGHGKHGH